MEFVVSAVDFINVVVLHMHKYTNSANNNDPGTICNLI